jgi:glycosyltransferase involved in cell wall biosynthesis
MHIFCQEFQKDDIVHSTATLYPPLGLIANILCLFKGCRKKLLVIDADTIGDLELLITLEKSVKKRLFYLVLKTLYALVLKFCIKLTPLTFVVGDALYERFKNYRRVVKIYASWVRRKDIIPSIRLLRKIEDLKRRDKIKLCFVAQLIPKKNPICAIYVARILKNNRVPFLIDIFGEGPMKKRLKRTCRKLNLADHVVFKGWSP